MNGKQNDNAKRTVIVGASSGIGAALARKLAGEGYRLMLLARREQQWHTRYDADTAALRRSRVDSQARLYFNRYDPERKASFWVAPVDVAVADIRKGIRDRKQEVYTPARWRMVGWIMRNAPSFLMRRLAV